MVVILTNLSAHWVDGSDLPTLRRESEAQCLEYTVSCKMSYLSPATDRMLNGMRLLNTAYT